MSGLEKVTGSQCLQYISKPIGFASKDYFGRGALEYINYYNDVLSHSRRSEYSSLSPILSNAGTPITCLRFACNDGFCLHKFNHNINKRIVGVVQEKYDDGGYYIVVLGDEKCNNENENYFDILYEMVWMNGALEYKNPDPVSVELNKKGGFPTYPTYSDYPSTGPFVSAGRNEAIFEVIQNGDRVPFDDTIDFHAELSPTKARGRSQQQFDKSRMIDYMLTNNPNTTLHYGSGVSTNIVISSAYTKNPLQVVQGDLFHWATSQNMRLSGLCPSNFPSQGAMDSYINNTGIEEVTSMNLVCVIYNMILTNDLSEAQAYLNDGTLPSDAFLFPLDWENLPIWSDDQPDPDENPDDFPNDNDPDDNDRNVTPNLPQVPTFTPAMLSNYNWYWLQVGEYASFIDWFWNDIGTWSDFGDFVQTIMGLYNDLASAILMVRYFPVDVSWIGGTGTQSKIIVGMIEQDNSLVDTISQSSPPPVRDIGHIKIDERYKSFIDLTPYTQLSLYLPFYGFVDMDIDILMGHTLYVKGIYDYLTGTIQYLLYYDNQVLINSFVAKFAVDIPISLQTKNDRDNAIFSNVLSALGGAVGVVGGVASGNPVGMALGATQGVQSMMGASASAPLNVKGTVGETGALYAPPQCAIILRRPTIQSSNKGKSLTTWKHNIGQLCGYGYTLKNLQGAGFTTCHTPRIDFRSTVPMQQEIDEIYSYLESGVIL